tara:strand:+ start:961 stop:1137 length:177 start_codon:yes stop_codon:yes gene_type:complete
MRFPSLLRLNKHKRQTKPSNDNLHVDMAVEDEALAAADELRLREKEYASDIEKYIGLK